MLPRLQKLIRPPTFPDEDRTRIARLLTVTLYTILLSALLYALALPTIQPDHVQQLALIIGVFPFILFLIILMHRGRLQLASVLLIGGMWCVMTLSMLTSGGIYSSSASVYVVFILAAALLLGGRYGILVALLSILASGLILWSGTLGIITQQVIMSPAAFWLVQSLIFGMTALLLYLDTNSMEATLRRIHEDEAALMEGNRALRSYADQLERRESTLAATQERYRIVSELVSDYAYAIKFVDDDEIVLIWVTDAFARISGYQPQELPDSHAWLRLIETDDLPIIQQWIQASLAGEEHTCDYRIRTKAGERRWLRNYSRPIRMDQIAQVSSVYGAVQDITLQKEAEAEQARLLTEISRQREELRALNSRLAEAQELERTHLVQELHDEVGQNLTAIALNLNIVKGQLDVNGANNGVSGEEKDATRVRLDDTIGLVRQTTVQIRDVMADLRPPVLDDYGLTAALEWYGVRISQRTGLTVTVSCDASMPRLDAPTETALFRIAQEAITNIVKHAHATSATVILIAESNRILLTIADDGKGITSTPSEPHTERSGWGLLTMQQRAEAVGGQFCIESTNGYGTVVIVEAPT